MSRWAWLVVLSVGCSGGTGAGESPTNGWWSNTGDDLTSPGSGSGAADGEEWDEDDDEEGPEAIWWGDMGLEGGTWVGETGVYIHRPPHTCEVIFEPTAVQVVEDCDACSVALRFTLSDGFREIDEGCDNLDEVRRFDGATVGIGIGGEVAYEDQAGTWAAAGDGEATDGFVTWDVWLGDSRD